jgi:hypothetical protein
MTIHCVKIISLSIEIIFWVNKDKNLLLLKPEWAPYPIVYAYIFTIHVIFILQTTKYFMNISVP